MPRKDHSKQLQWQRERYYRLRDSVFTLLGSKCVRCGFSDRRALQFDHIDGGGNKRRQAWGVDKELRYMIEVGGEGYQVLCANCNWIKRFERNET